MTRSEIMSRIKSKGNKSTEMAMMQWLRAHQMTGWRRHVKVLGIDVDFVFPKRKTCLFVDGCFWHWCPKHTNVDKLHERWREKIQGNFMRDGRQIALLMGHGWTVIRVWEHTLDDYNKVLKQTKRLRDWYDNRPEAIRGFSKQQMKHLHKIERGDYS